MDEVDHEIQFDAEYTEQLREEVLARYPTSGPRNATHVSDLLYCLRKSWKIKKQAIEGKTEELSDATALTFMGGLDFERLVEKGDTQSSMAYCFKCAGLSGAGPRGADGMEKANCPVCNERWLIFTPDWIEQGVVHESKQTRKSSRSGPASAPWWIDQLRSYIALYRLGGKNVASYGRLVVNWLMGDYGSRKKGIQPRGPQAGLDTFKVIFKEGFEAPWRAELRRRKEIVEGEEMPELSGMLEHKIALSPQWDFECASCPVGEEIECERYIWRDGKELASLEDEDD